MQTLLVNFRISLIIYRNSCTFRESKDCSPIHRPHDSTHSGIFITKNSNIKQSRYTTHETEYAFSLANSSSNSEEEKNSWKKSFKVVPNTCMEICFAQFWSSLDPSTVDVEIKFSGVFSSVSNLTNGYSNGGNGSELNLIDAGNSGFSRIDVVSTIRRQELNPSVSLSNLFPCFYSS